MTTSGTWSFTATRNDIIYFAARKLTAQATGVMLSAQELSDMAFQLNAMVKEWGADGIHVWTVTEATLFPQVGQESYQVGVGSPDHVTQAYTASTLASAAAAGALSVTLASGSGFVAGQFLGIVLDSSTIQWQTVVSAVGAVVTFATPLTGSASLGNSAYTYVAKITQPLDVVDGRRLSISDGRETPLAPIMAYLDYRRIPNKKDKGLTSQLSYNRQLGIGLVYLWLAPADVSNLINITWHRPIMDFNNSADTPDIPVEWVNTLGWNLAQLMAAEYTVPPEVLANINAQATLSKDVMRGLDREQTSIRFEPRRGRRRW